MLKSISSLFRLASSTHPRTVGFHSNILSRLVSLAKSFRPSSDYPGKEDYLKAITSRLSYNASKSYAAGCSVNNGGIAFVFFLNRTAVVDNVNIPVSLQDIQQGGLYARTNGGC